MKSVMSHNFSQVPHADIQRSSFDRSHGHKTTFDSGYLVPVFFDEVIPGDSFSLNMTAFARLATPLHPFMDNVFLNSFFFFVPYRLVWNNFQRFMGEQDDPDDSTDFLIPQMTAPAGGYATGSIYDHFGLPVQVANVKHSSLFFRAYNLIWNQWFRDQNMQDSVLVPKGDTEDPTNTYTLLRRGKRHDYFTSALPWAQKGPAVDIPLGISAPVRTTATGVDQALGVLGPTGDDPHYMKSDVANVTLGPNGAPTQLYTDLTEATSATINSLRQAFAVQRFQEQNARGGTRYTEIIRSHFNVTSPDARLQRPEYLGGGQSPVNLYSVPQTSAADTQPTPQGNLAAYGTLSASGHGFTKSFTEHGCIVGLVSVRADLNYQQGLNRMWSRRTRHDFYWPAFAHLGEQAVLNKEIYAQGTATDEEAFGYQERYGEYRFHPSIITGELRSTAPQSLDTWHLAQQFGSLPRLDAAFIQDHPPMERVLAVTDEPQFIFDSYFKLRCARPMPVYGVPGLSRL